MVLTRQFVIRGVIVLLRPRVLVLFNHLFDFDYDGHFFFRYGPANERAIVIVIATIVIAFHKFALSS